VRVRIANFVICSGVGADAPSGLTLVQSRAVQDVDYVRASYGAQFARGQFRHEVGFRVTRLHADLRAAQLFVLDHAQAIPQSGILAFEHRGGVGSGSRWIRDALVVRVECVAHIGLTTVWSYQFLGGEILTVNPYLNPSVGLNG
jgi:hypothetical protein